MSGPLTSPPERRPIADDAGDPITISVVEEKAKIEKREIEQARIRIATHTDLVEEHHRETLLTDEVEVARVPVNRTLDPGEPPPTVRTEGNVTIVPVLEERIVVEKRLFLKEEIHILREQTTEEVDVPVTIRKQHAVIERTGPDGRLSEDT